jgi:histidinol phosphatase-like enzyme (inositol monophosphatase family)
MVTKDEKRELLTTAKKIVLESGAIIRKYYKRDLKVKSKSDSSEVTEADIQTESFIREMLQKEFPDHGIIGEEFGTHESKSHYQWVIDPIDGTRSFIAGSIDFGTMLGLTYKGTPIIGLIYQPIVNELYFGDNDEAFLNDMPIHVRHCNDLSEAVLLVTDIVNVKKYQNSEKFETLYSNVKFLRTYGNCYGYALLTSGYADIMIDPIMNYWDIISLVPIVCGAGGIITDYKGNDVIKSNSTIASTSEALHEKVLKILN